MPAIWAVLLRIGMSRFFKRSDFRCNRLSNLFQVLCLKIISIVSDVNIDMCWGLTRSKSDYRFSTQVRLNAVQVMRLLHDTLTLKEAEVALNTDMYNWTWPNKLLRLTVSLKEVLFCKLSALRVHHVDTNHCDLHMTSKMKGRSFFKILWNLPQLCKCLLHWVSFCFWVYLNLLDFLADLSLIFTWILHPGFHC